MARSIEEQVEDWAKAQLVAHDIKYYPKTDKINEIIADALQQAPSKQGGDGANLPDIKALLASPKDAARQLPVMCEVKGIEGKLVKLNKDGSLANMKSNGDPNYSNINAFAVNGAVHYAEAVVGYASDAYPECLAIGVNGYNDKGGQTVYEIEAWYIDKENFGVAKKIGNYTDLSFLYPEHQEELFKTLDECVLTEEELEEQRFLLETAFDGILADYNQYLKDELNINADNRIALTVGLILAGIGTDGVAPLRFDDFKGDAGSTTHDGQIVYNKVASFLERKGLPQQERFVVMNYLEPTFNTKAYWIPMNGGFSKLALAYRKMQDILPLLLSNHRIDYMGKLFNKLLA